MAIPGIRNDPLPAFNFIVSLIDSSSTLGQVTSALNYLSNVAGLTGFNECSGLEATMQVEEYSEGGENRFVHKFPTRMTYSNIVLKRGITLAEDLWNWHTDYVKGRGKRRDGIIILQSELRIPLKIWVFEKGLPLKWSGPSLNAAQSAVAIETLEIAHQGLKLASLGTVVGEIQQAIF